MTNRHILIVGASGLVGAAAADHFSRLEGWNVTTLSRREPLLAGSAPHISVDLTDRDACMAAMRECPPVTDILYAALYEDEDLQASWRSQTQAGINLTMLRNIVESVETQSTLRHITILQGGKAYGTHLGRVPVPAKERWPRLPHHIFYWQQEDYLRARSAEVAWNFTILRPQLILGLAPGSPINIIAAVGVYACVMRELGRPLCFPGGGSYVTACADSRLIARAAEFAFSADGTAGETFNVVNGDVIVWRDLWPSIASHFGMPTGEDSPMQLATDMPLLSETWQAMVVKYGLKPFTMEKLVGSSWQVADITFGFGKDRAPDRIMSPIKTRKAGFADCFDTEDAILYWLNKMQTARLLPTFD